MGNKHPSKEECLLLLKEYRTPDHVIRHCMAVTEAALALASALNEKGFDFDLDLIRSAGMIHDIARVEDKHGEVGANFALAHGFFQEAEIIREHMTHPFDTDPKNLKELDLVCLGDRLIMEDEYVGIDARMQYVIDKHNGDPRIAGFIKQKTEITRELLKNIEKIIGISTDILLRKERNGQETIK